MQRLITDWLSSDTSRPQQPSTLVLNPLCLPVSMARRPGTCKFVVRRVPASTIARVEELLADVNSDGATMIRLFNQFSDFKALNFGLVSFVTKDGKRMREEDRPNIDHILLTLFIIDIIQQGIKASSALTYTHLIIEASSRNDHAIKGCFFRGSF